MKLIRPNILIALIAVVCLAAIGCGDDESPTGTGQPAQTTIATHQVTIENADYNSYAGQGYVNLYDGVVYGGADATANADKIDFRHQYRGGDIGNARLWENMTHKNRWGGGLFSGITPTDSRIEPTTLSPGDFNRIRSDRQLLDSFDFAGPMDDRQFLMDIDNNPAAAVYAFIDKNGKRGLFRVVSAEVAPVDSRPQGNLRIEVKVEL